MQKLIDHYRKLKIPNNYYENIRSKVFTDSNEYISSDRFLDGVPISTNPYTTSAIDTSIGDVRIDVPVWFGNLANTKLKVVVIGLEPRDTNSNFNLDRSGNNVFASPFGVDRWNENSSIKRKPQNKYLRVFGNHIENDDLFLLFTDFVKEYKVLNKNNKRENDLEARNNFINLSSKWRPFIEREIEITSPDAIVVLGNEAYNVAKKVLFKYRETLKGIRHPAQGGEKQSKLEFVQLINSLG